MKLSNSLLRSMKIKDKNILNKQKENPLMRWKVQEYGSVLSTETYLEDMHQFIKQDKQWKIIDYTERQIAIEKMYEHIIERLEQAIAKHHAKDKAYDGKFSESFSTEMFDKDVEKVSKEEYKTLITELQKRMREIQFALYDRKIPLILVFEGMDAAGKGGNIKRIRKSLIQLVMKLMVSVHRQMLN